MRVPLLDLQLQYKELKEQIRPVVEEVIDSQQFILGDRVAEFEKAICQYTGAAHAVGASSGTDALLLILMALGVGPGDAVITTPYTFFATAGCISRVGARPVFVDIDPESCNMCADALESYLANECSSSGGQLLAATGEIVRAIMPVHLYGLVCDMDRIGALAASYGLPVIEDAAQALGAEYPSQDGIQQSGAIAEFGYYSFFPSKNLGAFGDGGMAVCRDEAMAVRMRALRNHGMEQRYYHRMIGGNFRLDALQAAILNVKLPNLNRWSAARRANAAFYRQAFAETGLDKVLALPCEPYAESGAPNHHIYNQFVVRAQKRDALCKHLEAVGIGHAIYYPVPLHLQECYAGLGYNQGDFPESEKAALETLALPIFPELTREQQSAVVSAMQSFYMGA